MLEVKNPDALAYIVVVVYICSRNDKEEGGWCRRQARFPGYE